MIGRTIPVKALSAQLIPNASEGLLRALGIRKPSLALLSGDCDDVTYIALDEATKRANVEVVYAKSLYAGAANASTALAGEVIGILAGASPSEVQSGLQGALEVLQSGIGFVSANADESVVYLAHTVSACGNYLAQQARVKTGQALAYLVAPPVEAMVGLDAAMKAADVQLRTLFAPPSETNFGGGLLSGSQSACDAACQAFAAAVRAVAEKPIGG